MSKLIVTELQPIVDKGLSVQANKNRFIQGVGRYVDMNSKVLSAPGPTERMIFGDRDRSVLYDHVKITPEQIRSTLKKSKEIKPQWDFMNEPFNTAAALVVRHASLKNDRRLLETSLMYLSMPIYGYIQYKYFQYQPIDEVMNYTIANLSNKYKIRQMGSMLGAIQDTVETCYKTQKSRIERGTDVDIIKFIMDITTRINSLVKNIAIEFYKNSESKNYLNSDSNNFDEEDYYEADSDSYGVSRVSEAITLNLVTMGPNSRHISMASRMCGVSQNEVRNYVNSLIQEDNHKDIFSMVEAITYTFVVDGKNNVNSIRNNNRFLTYSIDVYKRSNTSNENIIKIKEILDKWMKDLDVYKKTQRQATINNFRRAIYIFFVLTIMSNA